MSFTFSFAGDDIEEAADQDADSIDTRGGTDSLATQFGDTKITSHASPALIQPKLHTLAHLLQSLPSQISYNIIEVKPAPIVSTTGQPAIYDRADPIKIPRRALFDIRQQLMHEADPSTSEDEGIDDPMSNLLAGLETGDLSTGIYEGGFKTWECAVDLASYLLTQSLALGNDTTTLRVIELGAGSAIPSLLLLTRILKQRLTDHSQMRLSKVRFTLCDYNEDVLRLCTAVNVFMAANIMIGDTKKVDIEEKGELDIEDELVSRVIQTLQECNIEIDFISGAWGDEFLNVLNIERSQRVLALASETIYSPGSLGVFTKTIRDIKDRAGSARTLVAAKKVYFGVGGGVQEFQDVLLSNARDGPTSLIEVLDVPSAGVGRVVLEMV